jgi:hypothetical protein
MREARIAMRTIDAARVGGKVSDADLKRMAEAAGRVGDGLKNFEAERLSALDWLLERHRDRGLVALAKSLSLDPANLAKLLTAKRKPSRALTEQIKRLAERPNTLK